MSFNRFETDDFVISADSITSTLWSDDVVTLSTFYTSSTQEAGSSGDYYLAVYQTASNDTTAKVQFDIAYGNKQGSGSIAYNNGIAGKSPTSTIYGQYRTMVLGDENTDFAFGDYTATEFIAVPIERARYKEGLLPGSLNLTLTKGAATVHLTDNSKDVASVTFVDAGRKFELVSGSNGSAYSGTGYTAASGSYGWMLPDIGILLLNSKALEGNTADGGIGLAVIRTNATNGETNTALFDAIDDGNSFQLNSQETITSDFVFVRLPNSEFNYTTNPSMISGSGDFVYSSLINNPQTYVTTVGMYNDNNELLAVAKMSKPLVKDFTKEALIRVKLDF